MKNKSILIALFALVIVGISANSKADLSRSEKDCVVKMVYHEARSLSKSDWLKVANVALNRKYDKARYKSRSKHLCDIVKSKEFDSAKNLNAKIKEPERFNEIQMALADNDWQNVTNALFFKTVNGQMVYWR